MSKARSGGSLEVDGRTIAVTNLDKVLWPEAGFTKGEMLAYYRAIAPVMVPHVRGRPMTLKRYPDGVDSESFYEKNAPRHRPEWLRTARILAERSKREIDFALIDDTPSLLWAAQLASIELHVSLSLAERLDRPTMLVFDLDPGPPATIVECCEVGLLVRDMLLAQDVQTFAKSSGSKGLQLYAPLNSRTTYDETKAVARVVAEVLERGRPDLVVSRMKRALRPGKVFVDWSQNDVSKTTVSVYSLRARERPTVSTPVSWDEVERALARRDAGLLRFEAADVLARIERDGDLFAPTLELEQQLPKL